MQAPFVNGLNARKSNDPNSRKYVTKYIISYSGGRVTKKNFYKGKMKKTIHILHIKF